VAKNWPNARYIATDISPAALEIAAFNAKRPRLAGRVEFVQGDLLQPVPVQADVVAANLPYIPTDVWQELPPEIRDHEPREALDGGVDGLAQLRRLIASAPEHLAGDGALLLEVGDGQAPAVLELLSNAFPTWRHHCLKDLAGIDRAVVADGGAFEPPARSMGKAEV
jgi:release factor glutamine methyltransferase